MRRRGRPDAGRPRVIRTVVEVAGHTRFKGYPKSAPGRRSLPLPGWLVEVIRVHTEQYGYGEADLMFGNEVGAARRRTDSRARGCGPRSTGPACSVPSRGTMITGWRHGLKKGRNVSAKTARARRCRRSRAGRPACCAITICAFVCEMVGRRWGVAEHGAAGDGHERASTTLDLYTRRTDDAERILRVPDDSD